MPRGKQSYSEQEASLILRRAGELAAHEPHGDARRLSLSELEASAEEAGIDRALVRRAAGELRHTPSAAPPDHAFLGGPTAIVFEAVVDGELATDAHEHVVHAIRRHTSEQGSHDVLGATLTWSTVLAARQMGRNILVTVSPRHGVTTIRVEERLGQLAGAMFGGILGGVGGGGMGLFIGPLIVLGYPTLIPVALAAWVGGVWGIVRKVYGSKARARQTDLRTLLRTIVEVAEDCIAKAG